MPAEPGAVVALESPESLTELVIVEACLNVIQHLLVGIVVEMMMLYIVPDIMCQELGLVELQDLLIGVTLCHRNDVIVNACHCCWGFKLLM